jgi:hypothetical protein
MNTVNALRKGLLSKGIVFPLCDFIPQMTFDQYVDERMFIFCGHLFANSDYLRGKAKLKHLDTLSVDISIITIEDENYKEKMKAVPSKDKFKLFISDNQSIVDDYNKIMKKNIPLLYKTKASINTNYEPKNNYLVFIYEKIIGTNYIGGHIQVIYVNQKNKCFYLFDPSSTKDRHDYLTAFLLSKYFKGYTFKNIESPEMDFQSINTKLFFTLDTYCVTWSFMMAYLFITNPKINPMSIVNEIWKFRERSRFLMVYFGYLLYEDLSSRYMLTEEQNNKLSLHNRLNEDIRKLDRVNTHIASRVKEFLKLYDIFVFYLHSDDEITQTNEFLYDNIMDLMSMLDKSKIGKDKAIKDKSNKKGKDKSNKISKDKASKDKTSNEIKQKFIDFVYSVDEYLPPDLGKKIIVEQINNECVLF